MISTYFRRRQQSGNADIILIQQKCVYVHAGASDAIAEGSANISAK
jgi:hypothetical protein